MRGPSSAWLVVLALLAAPPPARADTLRVPADFPTIQAAVDAAVPGDTLVISAGTYAESVVVEGHTDLRIRGRGLPTLDAQGAAAALTLSDSFDVEVRGLHLANASEQAVRIGACLGVRLERCRIESAPLGGFLVEGSFEVALERCDLLGLARPEGAEGAAPALLEADASALTILRSTLTGGAGSALRVTASELTLQRSTIEAPAGHGVHLVQSYSVLERNRILAPGGAGVHVSAGSARLERNRIDEPFGDGLVFDNPTQVLVYRNEIRRPAGHGVVVRASNSAFVRNTVREPGGSGFLSQIALPLGSPEGSGFPSDDAFVQNRVERAGLDGFALSGSGHDLVENRVSEPQRDGLNLTGSGHMVESNRIERPGREGLLLSLFTAGLLAANRIVRPVSDGIVLEIGSDGNTLQGNEVQQPQEDGLEVKSNGNGLDGNVVEKAGSSGFVVQGTGNTFTANRATHSGTFDLKDSAGVGANTYEPSNHFGTESFQ